MIIDGYIKKGRGNFKKYKIPGRDKLPFPPHCWPIFFEPGTVNFRINDNFSVTGKNNLISYPCNEIPDHLHCLIAPIAVFSPAVFEKGFHDNITFAWRARLRVSGHNGSVDCWILRRKNATYKRQLEIISEINIRKFFEIEDEKRKYPAVLEIIEGESNQIQ